MIRNSVTVAAAMVSAALPAMALAQAAPMPTAQFDYVEYRSLEDAQPTPAGSFRNPVLPGFHPDPSIVKVGDDFYAVTSTFSWYPGLPIMHSTDLVNWRQIGNAIDRPGMVDFGGLGTNRGLFAPAITHHDGKFWITNTCIECGDNFVITADDPAGPWSEPHWLDFGGIDPSLYFEGDRAWIVYNDAPPGPPQYDGHRALWLQEFDKATMQVKPERTLLRDGGVDFSTQPVWAEGPHIYKVDGWYYLLTAEGGTADQHSQTIYRSRKVDGPYEPGPLNPILTQRNMDPNRPDRVEATGHADIVRLDNGDWWGVFLATRPFENQSTLLGRETFLLPVQWENEFPYFLKPGEFVPPVVEKPALPEGEGSDWSAWREDFDGANALGAEWIGLRTPGAMQQVMVDSDAGTLSLIGGAASAGSLDKPAFVGRRMRHHEAEVTTRVDFAPSAAGQFAGLLAFMDEGHFLTLGVEGTGGGKQMVIRRRAEENDGERGEIVASAPYSGSGPVELRLRIEEGAAHGHFRTPRGSWQQVGGAVDVEPLASVYAGLFTGVVIGPYAVAGE